MLWCLLKPLSKLKQARLIVVDKISAMQVVLFCQSWGVSGVAVAGFWATFYSDMSEGWTGHFMNRDKTFVNLNRHNCSLQRNGWSDLDRTDDVWHRKTMGTWFCWCMDAHKMTHGTCYWHIPKNLTIFIEHKPDPDGESGIRFVFRTGRRYDW